jgi:hypothetical protein
VRRGTTRGISGQPEIHALMTVTAMRGYDVVDTRTLRHGWLAGPVHWRRGVLYAAIRMTDTGRIRAVRTDVLAFPWDLAASLRAERARAVCTRDKCPRCLRAGADPCVTRSGRLYGCDHAGRPRTGPRTPATELTGD